MYNNSDTDLDIHHIIISTPIVNIYHYNTSPDIIDYSKSTIDIYNTCTINYYNSTIIIS